jgi:uncharacterized protein (DUF1778 family)
MHKTRANRAPAKESRISVRIKPSQKAIIARAAKLKHTTLTDFVIENAFQSASQLVAEETHFQMTPEEFNHFCRVLDAAPAKNLKAMLKLLNEPSVLDE